MLRSIMLAIVVGANVPVAAVAAEVPHAIWPAYQYTSDHNAVFDFPQWDVSWKADIGGKNNGGIAVVGDTVYVESFAKKAFAFDAVTGTKKWEQTLDDVVMTTPLIAGGFVYVGSGTGDPVSDNGTSSLLGRPEGNGIFALDRTDGRIVWRFHTAGEDMPTGILTTVGSREALIFHNGDGHLRALDASNGTLLWERPTPGNDTMSSLAFDDGAIYGISAASYVWMWGALKRNDLVQLKMSQWTWAARPDDGQFSWTSSFGSEDCSPTVADGVIFTEGVRYASLVWMTGAAPWPGGPTTYPDWARTTLSSEVDAMDARTGSFLWSYRSSPGPIRQLGSQIDSIPGTYVDGTLYQSLPYAREFSAFDAKSGRVRWSMHTKEPVKMGSVEKGGLLYFGDNGGNFYVVRAADGSIENTIKFSDPFGCSPPLVVGNTLFITNVRTLYALRLRDLARGTIST
jgi:outer membrane protein assembly factor BamB